MKKALIVSTVASTIDQFCMINIRILQTLEFNVEVIANFKNGNNTSINRIKEFKNQLKEKNVIFHDVSFSRRPYKFIQNFKAFKTIKTIFAANNYSLIHCHTPIAGFYTRLAAKKTNAKIVYTAHGFHFYKGAPFINKFLYYFVEKYLAKYTDALITINDEDYQNAQKFKIRGDIYKTHGVGISIEKFTQKKDNLNDLRRDLGINNNGIILLSVGELNKNKNHKIVIKALSNAKNKNLLYLICGKGKEHNSLIKLARKLRIEDSVKLLGYREDVSDIYGVSTLFIFPSHREGLSVALMEAMASGLPCVVSNIRGNIDLIDDNLGGICISGNNQQKYANSIDYLLQNSSICEEYTKHNYLKISKFGSENVGKELLEIYSKLIKKMYKKYKY